MLPSVIANAGYVFLVPILMLPDVLNNADLFFLSKICAVFHNIRAVLTDLSWLIPHPVVVDAACCCCECCPRLLLMLPFLLVVAARCFCLL
jgi:hypothetical protein